MKSIKLIILVVACSIVFISCEKEIDLDLNESAQLLVVEGIVHDNLGDNFVALSKTRAYDDNNAIEMVSGASVQITDGLGAVYSLYEISPGYYTDSTLLGIEGRTYSLSVNVNGEFITASSFMNPRIELDSITYEEETLFSDDDDPEYRIFCHFTDAANYENFYRIKTFDQNGQKDGYNSFSDEYIDGVATYIPVFEVIFSAADTVRVELLSVDEVNFRYFTAVYSSQGGDVPGNPQTNLSGESAVGYFGAYAKSEKTIIIGE